MTSPRRSAVGASTSQPLLRVEDLSVVFQRKGETATRAVDGVSFSVAPGQTLGLVGESGCGKSVTSLAIMGLLPERGVTVSGAVYFEDRNLLELSDSQLRDLRGAEIAMIFQDPLSALNPVIPIGIQVTEVLSRHRGMKGDAARTEAVSLLDRVGIPDPKRRLDEYPHQLSGGMRQRALIAMALACQPRLLIADEPTTALDVTIQAQILELLRELVVGSDTALVLITHDLGVVAGLCDSVHVMYAGRIIENANRREIFYNGRHPYTGGLLGSIPRLDAVRGETLHPIRGSARDVIPWLEGCAFAPRCDHVEDDCVGEPPPLGTVAGGHRLRCLHPLAESELPKTETLETIA